MIGAILKALAATGATTEMLVAAAEVYEQHTAACYAEEAARRDAQEDARRAKDRERKYAKRHGLPPPSEEIQGSPRTSADPLIKESTKENITPVSSLRSETSSVDAREAAPESGCRVEFTYEFWPAYPHQVAPRKALQAFIAARQRASLETIMAGLERYRRDKPPDQHWLNPANFLEDDRFNDKPASPPTSRGNRPQPTNDAFRAEFLRAAEEELRQGGDGAGPDGRDDNQREGQGGAVGQHLDLAASAFRRAG